MTFWRRRCSFSKASVRDAPPISSTPGSAPSKTCCTAFQSATKIAAGCSRSPRSSRDNPRRSPARILSCGLRSTRRPGFKIFEALVGDASGALRATWLNQPFLRDVFATGQHVVLYGPVEMRGYGGLQLTNPQYEILDEEEGETIHTGRIVPGVREDRRCHAEDAAPAGVRGAAAASSRSPRSSAGGYARAARAADARRGAPRGAFPAGGCLDSTR